MRRVLMPNNQQVTVNMPKDLYQHLERKVIRKIRLGEEGPVRASVAEQIRELIRADMGKVDA